MGKLSVMDVKRLKQPGPASPLLDQLMRQTLADIEVISNVRAAIVGNETSRLKPGSSPPSGKPDHTVKRLKDRYLNCESNWERLKTIRTAQDVHAKMRKGAPLERRRGSREWKRAIATDTRASALVGADFGISASRVRQLRGELLREL